MTLTINPHDPFSYSALTRIVQANQEELRTLNKNGTERKLTNPNLSSEKSFVSDSEWWNE